MNTCRECRSSSEFLHYSKENSDRDQQQVYCTLHDTAEPVFTFTGKNQTRFVRLEAPRCFKR
jgi:hypothetical protein